MNELVDTFANRLNTAMRIRNMKATELSVKTGIAKSSLSEYINGKYEAKQDGVYLLSKALNVSEAWLMGLDVPMERKTAELSDQLKNIGAMYISNTNLVKIPILGTVKAGYDYMAQENWTGYVDVEKDIIKEGCEYFALKIVGDSMFPTLIEDDIVIIKKQDDFETGDIVVAIVNGDEATIKKGKKTDSSILLQPLNNSYEPLIFTYDEMKSIPVTVVGVVKQLKREF